jgi:Spy/CpxP family protein refolding chaperone
LASVFLPDFAFLMDKPELPTHIKAAACNIPTPIRVLIISMKTVKWVVISLIIAAVGAIGGIVIAAQTSATAPAGLGGRLLGTGRLRNQLGLTADQVATIKSDLAADKDALTKLLSAVHDARINLRETIRKSGASEADVRAASAKVAVAEADLAVERARLYGKISPVLTSDQLAKLDDLQERMDDLVDGAIAGFGRRLGQ